MGDFDLNLLKVFDALVEEGSVTGAAERLNLSTPAASRALGRLRRALADPIFVRAGRGVVPTPFALRTAPKVRSLLEAAEALLSDRPGFDPARLTRSFAIRVNDGLTATLAPALLRRVRAAAPQVVVRFVGEGTEDVESLRNGAVDLDVGAGPPAAADLRGELLYEERVVGVVSASSPLVAEPTLARICAHPHVSSSRRGRPHGPFDAALTEAGYRRHVATVVASPVVAAALAAESDLVALVPERLARHLADRLGVVWFPLPVPVPPIVIHQQWHARFDEDPAHEWLREQVVAATES
ncbi:LysR family transcriptional regulator [Actinokineospora auranticolor]|uniref:DNA-binding transcriptional LysR family regulator n=1 Tax=Actinokineospora auranticolor TaxID=155976 RepID=A0A2S6GTD9_9PSEU|nr:LysR family transcriptional regulator [Actinokineospora auranticolor]PPK68480.1 DNA-binding transcriptional LysR family regulator [Actinokineospora auranticolor]